MTALAAALAVAAAVAPVALSHPNGWWWTAQKANQAIFWWSATHGLDTTCRGAGQSIVSPFVEYKATKPRVNGDRQAEKGQPLFHHFRCRSADLKTKRLFGWTLHPTGKHTWIAS